MSPSAWDALARTPEEALAQGLAFLAQRRTDDGWWVDFRLAPGWSDEWVTGYVADRIYGIPEARPRVVDAWHLLRQRQRERPSPGWGFNALVPTDADSTSWALRAAWAAGAGEEEPAVRGRDLLRTHTADDGMLVTYRPDSPIREFIGRGTGDDLCGWTSPHACVTAAAAGGGLVDTAALSLGQRSDGTWSSYWWPDPGFVTALACEAISRFAPAEAGALNRSAMWAVSDLSPSIGSAFDLANRLMIAMIGGQGDRDEVARGIRTLTFTMQADGSWASGARLRVPFPADAAPNAEGPWVEGGSVEGALIVDARRVFTTATVVRALWMFVEGEARGE